MSRTKSYDVSKVRLTGHFPTSNEEVNPFEDRFTEPVKAELKAEGMVRTLRKEDFGVAFSSWRYGKANGGGTIVIKIWKHFNPKFASEKKTCKTLVEDTCINQENYNKHLAFSTFITFM